MEQGDTEKAQIEKEGNSDKIAFRTSELIEKLLYEIESLNSKISAIETPKSYATANGLYKLRRRRESIFSKYGGVGLFGEPAWDMLLDLYVHHDLNKKVSVTSLCIAANVPSTTALRWINVLIDKGLIMRENDQKDRRKVFLNISAEGIAAMRSMLRE